MAAPDEAVIPRPGRLGLFELTPALDANALAKNGPDFVAIHGITGDYEATWTFKNGTSYNKTSIVPNLNWIRDYLPHDLAKDFHPARVFSFGYDAEVLFSKSKANIEDFAKALLNAVRGKRRTETLRQRPLCFICHSMGGLVLKKAFVFAKLDEGQYLDFTKATKAIVFLSTPHRGSDVTGLPITLGKIADVCTYPFQGLTGKFRKELMKALEKDSPELDQIATAFRSQVGKSIIISCYETKATPPSKTIVVDASSGTLNLDSTIEKQVPMDGCDHSSVCRFGHPEDTNYETILGYLQDCLGSTKTEEHAKNVEACRESLYFGSMYARREDLDSPLEGTCHWLLEHANFVNWRQSHGILAVVGDPGAGKSTAMWKIEDFLENNARPDEVLITSYCWRLGDDLQKSIEGLFRTILYQLLTLVPNYMFRVTEALMKVPPGRRKDKKWGQKELQAMFTNCLPDILKEKPLTLTVDGLDECGLEAARDLVDYFRERLQDTTHSRRLSIAISCRKYPSIIESSSDCHVIDFENSNQTDIDAYIRVQLELHPALYDAIGEIVRKNAKGIFLWVVLVIQIAIHRRRDKVGIDKIRAKVEETPPKLQDLYGELISSIADDEKDDAFAIFAWVCGAFRPLTVAALHHATAVSKFDRALDVARLNATDLSAERIRTLTRSLIKFKPYHDASWRAKSWNPACTGDGSYLYREGVEVAQLMHSSVYEYLISKGGLRVLYTSVPIQPHISEGWLHAYLARCCALYVAHLPEQFVDESSAVHSKDHHAQVRDQTPLLNYSTRLLMRHTTKASCLEFDQQKLWQDLGWPKGKRRIGYFRLPPDRMPSGFRDTAQSQDCLTYVRKRNPLHVAATCGLAEVVRDFLEHGYKDEWLEVDREMGLHPLDLAVASEDIKVVTVFLNSIREHRVRGIRQWDVGSSVFLAVVLDDKTILRELCRYVDEKGLSINSLNHTGLTPLHHAIWNIDVGGADSEVLKILLHCTGIDVNFKDGDGLTALLLSLELGKPFLAAKILENSKKAVDISIVNEHGRSALSLAAEKGYVDIVRILLKRKDVNSEVINRRDERGFSALCYAIIVPKAGRMADINRQNEQERRDLATRLDSGSIDSEETSSSGEDEADSEVEDGDEEDEDEDDGDEDEDEDDEDEDGDGDEDEEGEDPLIYEHLIPHRLILITLLLKAGADVNVAYRKTDYDAWVDQCRAQRTLRQLSQSRKLGDSLRTLKVPEISGFNDWSSQDSIAFSRNVFEERT